MLPSLLIVGHEPNRKKIVLARIQARHRAQKFYFQPQRAHANYESAETRRGQVGIKQKQKKKGKKRKTKKKEEGKRRQKKDQERDKARTKREEMGEGVVKSSPRSYKAWSLYYLVTG